MLLYCLDCDTPFIPNDPHQLKCLKAGCKAKAAAKAKPKPVADEIKIVGELKRRPLW